MMDLRKLSEPLRADQIDFRVQSVNKGGYATILAYKDARCDMQRLDDVCGPLNWKREHVNGNANCIVSIWNKETKEWVSKEDTGTASNAEAAKGLASDSFKRACFNWGIGRELYDYPEISIELRSNEWKIDGGRAKATWDLKIKQWRWKSRFAGSELVYLAAKDEKGNIRFEFGDGASSQLAALLVGHYRNQDSEALLDCFNADNELTDKAWRLINSKDRAGINKMLKAERDQRKGEQNNG